MRLIKPIESNLIEMMSWFSSEQELINWSGPNFRYPFDLSSFIADLSLHTLDSFALVSKGSEFLAFGQYYLRLNKCHLGRLIVNPSLRGQGIVTELLHQLSHIGLKKLEVKGCSLFVLGDNANAIKAYQKFGFSFENYPDEMPLKNCLYMVK
jgi:ribosomal protein S18 acetylase RimI-like enzyme